jgi:hypothetical protein
MNRVEEAPAIDIAGWLTEWEQRLDAILGRAG